MKNEELNKAIAESLGWKTIECVWVGPKNWQGEGVPNYAESLDDCVEFENALSEPEFISYCNTLHSLFIQTMICRGWTALTAIHRCEAYLRIKGLWKEQ